MSALVSIGQCLLNPRLNLHLKQKSVTTLKECENFWWLTYQKWQVAITKLEVRMPSACPQPFENLPSSALSSSNSPHTFTTQQKEHSLFFSVFFLNSYLAQIPLLLCKTRFVLLFLLFLLGNLPFFFLGPALNTLHPHPFCLSYLIYAPLKGKFNKKSVLCIINFSFLFSFLYSLFVPGWLLFPSALVCFGFWIFCRFVK